MDNYQRLGIVVGQFLIGVGCWILGAFLGLLLGSGQNSDISDDFRNAHIGSYIGLFFGISYDKYKFLKENGRQKEYLKFFIQGFVGLAAGIVGYFCISNSAIRLSLMSITSLSCILPLLGTMAGVNYDKALLTNRE